MIFSQVLFVVKAAWCGLFFGFLVFFRGFFFFFFWLAFLEVRRTASMDRLGSDGEWNEKSCCCLELDIARRVMVPVLLCDGGPSLRGQSDGRRAQSDEL
jgi:hypothetical protein